ncbi:MAG: 50S ribosomal protein L11 methyltransferase [Bacteroidota bacterium]
MNKDYTRYTIKTGSDEESNILIATLSDWGIEGFEEADGLLYASGLSNEIEENGIESFLHSRNIGFTKQIIPDQNWNKVWESNFEPVQVGGFVGIRAAFHPPMPGVSHEILITPKMSFGTGHHATTYLVMELMENFDFKNKSVFDFGTGTGILAILAEKLGAGNILAVDYDDWCILNATENIEQNACRNISIEQADKAPAGIDFDFVIANINKNIILENLTQLVSNLSPGGKLILSGLLTTDEDDIVSAASKLGFTNPGIREKNGWIALFFAKSSV